MGLDALEIVLRIEETYGIGVSDDESGQCETVGQMYELMLRKLEERERSHCLSSEVFYKARRALVKLTGVNRKDVSPDTRLDDLFPRSTRRRQWDEYRSSLEFEIPLLKRPEWMRKGIEVAWLMSGIAALGLGTKLESVYPVSFHVLAWSFLLGLGGWLVTIPCAVHFPPTCTTMRGLVYSVLAGRYGKQAEAAPKRWTPTEVWETLRVIVAEELPHVEVEEVTKEAYWVKDLGVS